jgi:transcriptional regulator with XRE-family HTH domain
MPETELSSPRPVEDNVSIRVRCRCRLRWTVRPVPRWPVAALPGPRAAGGRRRAGLQKGEESCNEPRIVQAHEPPMSLRSDSVTGTRQDWQEIDNRPDRRARVEAPTSPPESPLRLARRHRNWTLERVVSEIDSHLGGSGVTASLLSAWERGARRTSPRYRAALCAIYGLPPETLFAHQDHGLVVSRILWMEHQIRSCPSREGVPPASRKTPWCRSTSWQVPSGPERSTLRVCSEHGPRFLANLWQMALRAEGEDALCLVELRGFEPLTPCMPCKCSAS